jgi:hypothetical protein
MGVQPGRRCRVLALPNRYYRTVRSLNALRTVLFAYSRNLQVRSTALSSESNDAPLIETLGSRHSCPQAISAIP